jgi:murein DD-endopeptidase MepM/ murein hydrolase activator NlpD
MARQESSYGNQIEIEFSENGKTYRAFYAHLSAISVSLFQVVKEGQVIGSTGHTGNANNLPLAQRHLHFEIRTDGGAGKHGSIDPSILLGGDILICHQ